MIGDNSRMRRSVVVYSFDRVGKPNKRPYVDLIPRTPSVTIRGARQFTLRRGDDWHTLAANTLGDMRHWWVVADYNNVVDPFETMVPGDRIAMPARDVVFFDMLDFDTPDTGDLGGIL